MLTVQAVPERDAAKEDVRVPPGFSTASSAVRAFRELHCANLIAALS